MFAYVLIQAAQAGRIALRVAGGEYDKLFDHLTLAKVMREKQLINDSLAEAIKFIGKASLSGSKALTAGYRVVVHLMASKYALPEPNDRCNLMVAFLLPVFVLTFPRCMALSTWFIVVCIYLCTVMALLPMELR